MDRHMRYPGFLGKALTLSYDDAVEQDAKLIEIMNKYGLKGTFNVCTEVFAPEGTVYPEGRAHRRMTEKASYDLYMSNGMEIAAHGCTHPRLEQLVTNECMYEIFQDKTNIEKATGKICRGFAYPYGSYNDMVVENLKAAGFLYARTVNASNNFYFPENWLTLAPTCHHNAPNLMDLANAFISTPAYDAPYLFYLWGHSFEFEMNNNWNVLEDFAALVGGREDIWYATNSEIFEYVEAYRQMQVSNDGKTYFNPTCRSLFFDYHGRMCEVKPGETFRL